MSNEFVIMKILISNIWADPFFIRYVDSTAIMALTY